MSAAVLAVEGNHFCKLQRKSFSERGTNQARQTGGPRQAYTSIRALFKAESLRFALLSPCSCTLGSTRHSVDG
jgi:hypothetical protein